MSTQNTPNPAEAYDSYLGPAIFAPWSAVLLERAQPRRGERVLDLACGTGIVTRQAAPLLAPGGRIVGVDRSPDMLAVARRLPAVEGVVIDWREGDASNLDLPGESFDLILCQQGLQFFPDKPAAVRGVRNVTRDGGRAVFAVWKSLEHHEVFRAIFTAEARHIGVDVEQLASPFSLHDGEKLAALFEEAGFGNVEVTSRTMDVRFPTPERFVTLTVLAGAAVIPELAEAEAADRDALVEAVAREASATVERFRQGEMLVFPMTTHIATARA